MKVVVLGKGLMLANLILGVLDAGAEIVGVFRYDCTCTNPVKLFFRDNFSSEPELTLLKNLNLPQLKFKSANCEDFRKFLISKNVDLMIVGTWKEKISKLTFDIPKIASINVHPSLLPKYRGPNPYMQTILHGEKFSGVTLHLIDENFDSGAILSQKKVEILDSDTSKELRERTVVSARKLVCEFISDLNDKIITPIAQSEKRATYFPNISGIERMLDFEKQSSVEITRTVRALHPFLPTYITYGTHFLVVNPYKMEIVHLDKLYNSGDIIDKNAKTRSLTIVCDDNIAVKFSGLSLYKRKFYTEKFIKKEIKTIFSQ